ncbi:MAG TPA: CBS domain-containing protein [Acidimicrobiales bacterium]|nr:CBS domain-containing protein [Acidimicrobiales bacterium]
MAQTIQEVMTPHPMALSAAMSVGDAARAMRERDVGDVIVIDDENALCGIVTDRDIVVRAVADDRNPSEVRLGDICSRDLSTVEVSASVKDAVKLMRDRALRRLPVVEDGRPVGIVSLGDLAIERDPQSTLADISAAPSNT